MANAKVSNKPTGSKAKNEPTSFTRETQVPDGKGKTKTAKMTVKTN